jgi:DnaK suppressor protein
MDVDHIERTLRAKREELEREIAQLTATPRDPVGAVSFGKRIGDGTTEAVERLNRVGVVEQLTDVADQVDRALAAVEDGTYGVCSSCGERIGAERLEAIPWTTRCVRCASAG